MCRRRKGGDHVVSTSLGPDVQRLCPHPRGRPRGRRTAVQRPIGRAKAERDELVYLALNDAVMAAAIKSARNSLPGFLALARHPAPEMKGFAVKIALLGDGGPEFFWIHPFAHVGARFIGQIGNMPRTVEGLKMGDTITFVQARHRRLDVHGCRNDAGQLFRARHSPDRLAPGPAGLQAAVRAGFRFLMPAGIEFRAGRTHL